MLCNISCLTRVFQLSYKFVIKKILLLYLSEIFVQFLLLKKEAKNKQLHVNNRLPSLHSSLSIKMGLVDCPKIVESKVR